MHANFVLLACVLTFPFSLSPIDVLLSYAFAAFESAKFAEGIQVQSVLDIDDGNSSLSHFYITLFLLEVYTVHLLAAIFCMFMELTLE